MRALELELVEYGHDVRDAQGHRIRLGLVRLIAASVTSMVDIDEPELAGELLQSPGDRRASDHLDRIEESPEDRDRHAFAANILEVHAARVTSVRRE